METLDLEFLVKKEKIKLFSTTCMNMLSDAARSPRGVVMVVMEDEEPLQHAAAAFLQSCGLLEFVGMSSNNSRKFKMNAAGQEAVTRWQEGRVDAA